MRGGVGQATGASIAALLVCASLSACGAGESESAGRRAQLFYESMAGGDFAGARELTTGAAALRRIERRFGGFAPWATRATKNSTLMRAEILDQEVDEDRAHVEVLLLFNDGTRRHDHIELRRHGGGWKVDSRSLPGAPRHQTRGR